mgnify:CR=1 FL=1
MTMNLGVQYYRPPFPNDRYWDEDFRRIKDSGLNTVQLWVLWGWVEPKPGVFVFDDYDRLVNLAEKHGLGVILSTIAEIQPYWIHREVPGSEMVTNMGVKVVSSNRGECHFGITPGGCTDHPGVWKGMERFLTQVVSRYRSVPVLRGWDIWNELRWNVNADGLVCYCEHTLAAFREWLDHKYGGLEGLNRSWLRRYQQWDEVMPGKMPDRPYTEMMAFENFITWRANQHGKMRYDVVKALDPARPVTVHGGSPCPLDFGSNENTALNRGNDWNFADDLDGIGCSSFPRWFNMDDADFGMRIEFVKSAAREKKVWLSELQGGRSAIGFNIYDPVDGLSQQRWIWNGIACGADTILFWCWRDEVFGRESAGFGLAGDDGLAEERLRYMRVTGKLIAKHEDVIDHYRPVKPKVGVLFSPQSYYLNWAQEANTARVRNSLLGYARALVRRSIPYQVVEENHLEALSHLKVLFMPRTIVVDDHTAEKLLLFVQNGGTLVCESECGAFNSQGLYRYPNERFIARTTGVREIGRRKLTSNLITASVDNKQVDLSVTQWFTPWVGDGSETWCSGAEGDLIRSIPFGKGRFIVVGSYLGDAYLAQAGEGKEKTIQGFETLVETIVSQAGSLPEIKVLAPNATSDSFLYVKSGLSLGKRVIFVFYQPQHPEAQLRFAHGVLNTQHLLDLISGESIPLSGTDDGEKECRLVRPDWNFRVLVEG